MNDNLTEMNAQQIDSIDSATISAEIPMLTEKSPQKTKKRIILISIFALIIVIIATVSIVFINNRNRMTFVFDDEKEKVNYGLFAKSSGYANIGVWATYYKYDYNIYSGERECDYYVAWGDEELFEMQQKYEQELEEEVFSFVCDSEVQLDVEKQDIIIFMDGEKYKYDLKIIDEDGYGHTTYAITTQLLSKKKFENDMFEKIMYVVYNSDYDIVTLYLNYNSDDNSFTSKLYDEANETSIYHFTIYNGFYVYDSDVDCRIDYELDD